MANTTLRMVCLNFLLLVAPFVAHSQVPSPFPDSTGSWNIKFNLYSYPPLLIETSYHRFFLAGDTTIGVTNYTNVFKAVSNASVIDTSMAHWCGGIRQDTSSKVWFRGPGPNPSLLTIGCEFPNDSTEVLLYDFDIEVGDSIFPYAGPLMSGYGPYTVLGLDTINYGGVLRRRWEMYHGGANLLQEYWIEGVGSNLGLFHPWCYMFEWDSELLCYQDPTINYDPGGLGQSCYQIVSIEEAKSGPQLEIGPNPAGEVMKLQLQGNHFLDTYQLEVFNLQGAVKGRWDLRSGQVLRIQKEDLGQGIFLYRLLENGQPVEQGKLVFH